MNGLCDVCLQRTDSACSDCRIDLDVTVYICSKSECRDRHEAVTPGHGAFDRVRTGAAFLRECERRAGAKRSEIFKYIKEREFDSAEWHSEDCPLSDELHDANEVCECSMNVMVQIVDWLRRILGAEGKP